MTMPPSFDKLAAKALADERLPDRAPTRAERAAAIDAIRGALAERRRARARRRWMFPLVAAAACAAAGVALWVSSRAPVAPVASHAAPAPTATSFALAHPSGGAAFVVSGGVKTPMTSPTSLAPRDAVLTGDSTVGVVLATGTRLDVERETETLLPDGTSEQLLELRRGAVTARVAKLAAGDRFVVRTSDAEVEVRGTTFRVARVATERCGPATRVEVTEGRVVVRENGVEHVLGPGDRWERACPAETPPAASSATAPRPAAPPRPAPMPASSSELAAQNALFGDAMNAKRRGDGRAAVASLDELVERHPRSPLREAAEAERMKLLATIDPARAQVAARAYVARYPNGFAVPDANAILAH